MNISRTLSKDFIELAKVQNENEKELLQKNNVVGVALGNKITNKKKQATKPFRCWYVIRWTLIFLQKKI